MYPTTPKQAVNAGPILFNTEPPKDAENTQTVHRTALTTWTVCAEFGLPPRVYAAGRLDYDSEGLLLLTDDGGLAHRLTDPKHKKPKTYWVQVEGAPDEERLRELREGVCLATHDGKSWMEVELFSHCLELRKHEQSEVEGSDDIDHDRTLPTVLELESRGRNSRILK